MCLHNIDQGGIVKAAPGYPGRKLTVPDQRVTPKLISARCRKVHNGVRVIEGEISLGGLDGLPLHSILWRDRVELGRDDGLLSRVASERESCPGVVLSLGFDGCVQGCGDLPRPVDLWECAVAQVSHDDRDFAGRWRGILPGESTRCSSAEAHGSESCEVHDQVCRGPTNRATEEPCGDHTTAQLPIAFEELARDRLYCRCLTSTIPRSRGGRPPKEAEGIYPSRRSKSGCGMSLDPDFTQPPVIHAPITRWFSIYFSSGKSFARCT